MATDLHMSYSMCMLNHRLQLLLDEDRHRRLTEEAERRHTSVAAVIRDAIDKALPDERLARRRAAIAAILATEPMPVPDDPEDLKREIDAMYDDGHGDWNEV
jgi:hypothetical protein